MISLRIRESHWTSWTEVSFSGDDEESASHIYCATLMRLGWEVLISRDEEEFYTLGEDEEPPL